MSQTDALHRVYDQRADDVPARPRWGWVLGVPVGVCGLVFSWRRWRQRRQSTVAKNG
ncbi:MAG: hypothetical protein L0Y71_09490 [Gemmataceae bacterium]|nr:hypothetical protein [Gemmataceae bacterium]